MTRAPALLMRGSRFKTSPSLRTSRSGSPNLSNPSVTRNSCGLQRLSSQPDVAERMALCANDPLTFARHQCVRTVSLANLTIAQSTRSLECACLPIRDIVHGSDSEKAQVDLPRSSYDRSTGRSDRQASLLRHGVYWLRVLRRLQKSFTIALLPAPLVAQL
jgi:hypothetical protein